MQQSGVIQQLYHHMLCPGWTNTSLSETGKVMVPHRRKERCCFMLRERAAPSCAHICLSHCKRRTLSLFISTKCFLTIILLGLFHCVPVFSGMELFLYSSKPSQPTWFLRGISCLSMCLTCFLSVVSCTAGQGWHIPSALSESPKSGAEGAARGCREEATSAWTGEREDVQHNPLFLQVSPA